MGTGLVELAGFIEHAWQYLLRLVGNGLRTEGQTTEARLAELDFCGSVARLTLDIHLRLVRNVSILAKERIDETKLRSSVLNQSASSTNKSWPASSNTSVYLFPETRVEVPVFNHAHRAFPASLVVEILGDESNKVIARHERHFEARSGRHDVVLDWDSNELPTKMVNFLSAYRLRYRLAPRRKDDFQSVQGIIQMGRHMVDGFGIQGYPSGEFPCALDCSFLVRVAEPNTGRALAGYDVTAKFGGDDGTVMHTASDADGYATLHCQIANDYARPEVMMDIRASRGPFWNGWGGEIFWRVPPHLTLTTDKHTYQPGETVRMRLVVTDVKKQRWAGANVSLTITRLINAQGLFNRQPVTSQVLNKNLVTSKSGEASSEWTIPENVENERFSIVAVSNDEPQGNWAAKSRTHIAITRTEQSKFVVSVVADRDYYLPGQIPNLTISATNLSGGPIREGKVSIKNAWDAVAVTGELNDTGRLIATINPRNRWNSLSNAYSPVWPEPRSWDFPADVTVTDMQSGKTELRHVVLQLASHEIHLAVNYMQAGSERTLGILSSYVDNSPASVDGVVEATVPEESGRCPATPDVSSWMLLGKFRTNAYGVARFTLPKSWIEYAYPKRENGPYSLYARMRRLETTNERATRNACILVRAVDDKGRTGSLNRQIWVLPETHFAIRFAADHALYRPRDPIHVRIESDAGLIEAVVEIRTSDLALAGAQHCRLVNGQADVTFPYTPQFRGLLTVQVYAVSGVDDPNTADSWSTEVIYPTGERIQDEERWGEEVRTPDEFQADNSGVGVTPVEEEWRRIAGIQKEDLLHLDPAKPIPDGMDLVAWALLGAPKSWIGWSWGYYGFRHEQFDNQNLAALKPALQKICEHNKPHPTTDGEVLKQLKEAGVDFAALRDGWEMPYRLAFVSGGISIVSNGADKTPNDKDDYVAEKCQWP